MRHLVPFGFVLCLLTGTAVAGRNDSLIESVEASVQSGQNAEAALDRLLAALVASRNEDDVDDLLDAVEEIGDADGTSPQAVKQYLRAKAPAALRQVFQGGFSWSLRGDALMVHRALEASDADLKARIRME